MGKREDREKALAAILEDDLDAYVEEAIEHEPGYRAALEDAELVQELLDELVALRKSLKLTQKEIARRMGVKQPTVSEFERESSDPRLSTLMRYARAVEARIQMKASVPASCDWVEKSEFQSVAQGKYHGRAEMTGHTAVKSTTFPVEWSQAYESRRNEREYGLAA